MADWEEQNKKMTKTGEGDDEKISQALDEGDIALLQVRPSFTDLVFFFYIFSIRCFGCFLFHSPLFLSFSISFFLFYQ